MRQYRNAPKRAAHPTRVAVWLAAGWPGRGSDGIAHRTGATTAEGTSPNGITLMQHPETERILEQTLKLDWIVIEALLAEETRPRRWNIRMGFWSFYGASI